MMNPYPSAAPEVGQALEHKLTHLLVRCLADGASHRAVKSFYRHKVIISQFDWRPIMASRCTFSRFAKRSEFQRGRFAGVAKSTLEWARSGI
jgi:hypothetical protein